MIAWFARNSVAANLLMLAVMTAGIWTLWRDKIPLEVFQDVSSRFISVNVPVSSLLAGGNGGNHRHQDRGGDSTGRRHQKR